MDVSDGDSEVDSDYNSLDAEQDRDEDILDESAGNLEGALVGIPARRRRGAVDAYKELVREDMSAVKAHFSRVLSHNGRGLFARISCRGQSPSVSCIDGRAKRKLDASTSAEISAKMVKAAASVVESALKFHSGLSNVRSKSEGDIGAKRLTINGRNASTGKASKSKATKVSRSSKSSAKSTAMSRKANLKASPRVSKKLLKHQEAMLSELFGPSAAKELLIGISKDNQDSKLFTANSTKATTSTDDAVTSTTGREKAPRRGRKNSASSSSSLPLPSAATESSSAIIIAPSKLPAARRRQPLPADTLAVISRACRSIKTKTIVTETRKFAGKEILVSRTEYATSAAEEPVVKDQFADDEAAEAAIAARKAKAGKAAQAQGLDSLLETIRGPQAINTVTKSAFDWQKHKVQEGLEDELKGAADAGFLSRRDFLDRVDVRTYEKERDARILEQASRKPK